MGKAQVDDSHIRFWRLYLDKSSDISVAANDRIQLIRAAHTRGRQPGGGW